MGAPKNWNFPELEKQLRVDVISEVAHEIKNPLSIIMNSSEFLLTQIESSKFNPQLFSESLGRILSTTQRISKIISTLHDEATENSLSFEQVDLTIILTDILSLFQYDLQLNGVEVLNGLDQKPRIIRGNSIQLGQVFTNLFANSLDAMKTSPQKKIELTVTEHADSYHIHFSDSGTGIPFEIKDVVMNRSFTTKSTGNGLGLFLVQTILKQHSGDLQITSLKDPTILTVLLKKHIKA
jgi:signal transduction histidine kinase